MRPPIKPKPPDCAPGGILAECSAEAARNGAKWAIGFMVVYLLNALILAWSLLDIALVPSLLRSRKAAA